MARCKDIRILDKQDSIITLFQTNIRITNKLMCRPNIMMCEVLWRLL